MVQGPALLQIMESPDDLRTALDCLERATDLLASIERCRYPGQASRTHSKARRSATTPVSSAPAVPQDPTEQLRTRILSFIERWWEEKGRGATMREIRNPNRTVSPDDITEMVSILVHEGKLQAVPVKRTVQYAPFGMIAAQPYKPKTYLQLGDQSVGVYLVTWQATNKKDVTAYTVNRSKSLADIYKHDSDRLMDVPRDLVFIQGSEEHEVVDDWIRANDYAVAYEVVSSEVIEVEP